MSKNACNCNHDSVDESTAVWVEPTKYNLTKHGPPYLKAARAVVAAAPDMLEVLVQLQALEMFQHTMHWNSGGSAFYGDHELFQRIYEGVQEGVDSVAERLIGSGAAESIHPATLATRAAAWVDRYLGASSNMLEASLFAEQQLLGTINAVVDSMSEDGTLTDGINDLLGGIASDHETFVYLLKQRIKPYNYAR
jgi:DNA-binding ferritin-like protein